MRLPAAIGDYTDFYASIHHATNVGAMFRPDNPLLPNYKWVPIGYHGRASSIVPSGTAVRRPCGQTKPADARHAGRRPHRGARLRGWRSGFFVGAGNRARRRRSPIGDAEDASVRRLPGQRLVRARHPDLGIPAARAVSRQEFRDDDLAVGRDARRARAVPRSARPRARQAIRRRSRISRRARSGRGGIDLTIEVYAQVRQDARPRRPRPMRLSRSNARDLYWTPAQLLTHHTSNGCNLRPGDLLASGTVSGPTRDALGCSSS